jgi:hypothetical protein
MELGNLGALSELLISAALWAVLVGVLAVLFVIVGLWWRDRM